MDIKKQESHSVFSKVFQAQGDNYLAITVMSAFSFDNPVELLDETDLWSFAGSTLSNHDVLDMFMPKQEGEILAAGKFFSPGRKFVRAGSVRISVGSVNKTLHVFGDRYWIKKAGVVSGISDPQPMTEMEITYVNAFGGPGYKQNPLGKGMAKQGSDASIPLPNIEYPDELIGSPADRPQPAGFGPLGIEWQQRSVKLGTYDQKWLETRWPWYPEDMDWTYFNAAPEDQIIDKYFRGDEKVVIENMHPELFKIETTLPGLRMRCFVEKYSEEKEIFKELKTRLDTIWLFPEQEMGALIWRATTEVKDEDATDISAVVIDHELFADGERPLEYYRQLLYMEAIEETELPEPPEEIEPETIKRPEQPKVKEPEIDTETQAMIKELEEKIAASEKEMMNDLKERGINIEQIMKELPVAAGLTIPAVTETPGELSLSDLEKEIARGEAAVDEILKKAGIDVEKLMEAPKQMEQAELPSTEELIKSIRESGIDDPEIEKYLLEMEKEKEEAEKEIAVLLEEDKKREAELGKEEPPEKEEAKEELEPETEEALTREKVVEGYGRGESFAEKDLSGLDLSGLELSGADFSKSVLENVNFSHTDLEFACFTGSIMTGAVLTKTRLSHARMAGCNLTGVHANEVDMSHADVSEADMSQGDFEGAIFMGSRMNNSVFEMSRLKGARFTKASLRKTGFFGTDLTDAVFEEADISNADFSETILQNTDFSRVKALSATFDGATGRNVTFKNSDLRKSRADETTSLERANFQNINLSEANWAGANLTSSILSFATLNMTDLSSCNLLGSDFYRAVAKKAKFSKADLTDANMTSINLFRGDLTKAKLIRTDLKGSNLFEVEFLRATVKNTNFQDANLKRTKLSDWVPK